MLPGADNLQGADLGLDEQELQQSNASDSDDSDQEELEERKPEGGQGAGGGLEVLHSRLLLHALPGEMERAVRHLQRQHRNKHSVAHALTYGGGGPPWPRIYRKPLKRGGHVVLDLCMPAGAGSDGGSNSGGSQGGIVGGPEAAAQPRLERQVCTSCMECVSVQCTGVYFCRDLMPACARCFLYVNRCEACICTKAKLLKESCECYACRA